MRTFYLERKQDMSGVSGTGRVAEGVVFSTGTVALHWCVSDKPQCTSLWESLADLEAVHGHEGATQVVFN